MKTSEIHDAIADKLESLNRAMDSYREVENEVKGLKAEVATLNVRLAAQSGGIEPADFARLVTRGLDAW